MPDRVTEYGSATEPTTVQEFAEFSREQLTEIGSDERSDMLKAGLAEHIGWIAGGVPKFRVETNLWSMYKDLIKAHDSSPVTLDPALLDPALYSQGGYFLNQKNKN